LRVAFAENRVSFKLLVKIGKPLFGILLAVFLLELVGSELLSCFGGCSQVTPNKTQLGIFGNI